MNKDTNKDVKVIELSYEDALKYKDHLISVMVDVLVSSK